jgi:Protein of unknown function, DUF547
MHTHTYPHTHIHTHAHTHMHTLTHMYTNNYTLHYCISTQGTPSTPQGRARLFNGESGAVYLIGGEIFSPDDIEHGILRGNTAHPSQPPTTTTYLPVFDPRTHLALPYLDPR